MTVVRVEVGRVVRVRVRVEMAAGRWARCTELLMALGPRRRREAAGILLGRMTVEWFAARRACFSGWWADEAGQVVVLLRTTLSGGVLVGWASCAGSHVAPQQGRQVAVEEADQPHTWEHCYGLCRAHGREHPTRRNRGWAAASACASGPPWASVLCAKRTMAEGRWAVSEMLYSESQRAASPMRCVREVRMLETGKGKAPRAPPDLGIAPPAGPPPPARP